MLETLNPNLRYTQIKEKEQIVHTPKGNMMESLLPVVDKFVLAKGSLKCIFFLSTVILLTNNMRALNPQTLNPKLYAQIKEKEQIVNTLVNRFFNRSTGDRAKVREFES